MPTTSTTLKILKIVEQFFSSLFFTISMIIFYFSWLFTISVRVRLNLNNRNSVLPFAYQLSIPSIQWFRLAMNDQRPSFIFSNQSNASTTLISFFPSCKPSPLRERKKIRNYSCNLRLRGLRNRYSSYTFYLYAFRGTDTFERDTIRVQLDSNLSDCLEGKFYWTEFNLWEMNICEYCVISYKEYIRKSGLV